MKKSLTLVVTFALFLLTLAACSDNTVYPEYLVTDNHELGCVELTYAGVTYRPFGVFANNKFKGTQIGIRENMPDIKIHEVKGYSSSEWIVEYDNVLMGGDMILKAVGVAEIPTALQPYKQYDY